MAKERKNKLEIGIDDPLENPTDDCLDRASFAKRIFKVIEGISSSTNLRVGIYGSWGSGKTTTMNFIKWYCQKAGHPVALYHPWQFHNREEAWKGFVASIDTAIAKYQGKKVGTFKRQDAVKQISKKVREVTKSTSVGKVIGSLLLAPLEGILESTKGKVQKELNKALENKRLFIFIDDLDRAEPDILYNFLMLLNEIVDLNKCIYIIGLDVNVASKVLKNKMNLDDSKSFLEKIINWPFDLPEPNNFDWQNLLDKEVSKLDESVKKNALESVFPFLPRNPRKFKYYLRYLNGLHKGFLKRFADYELDWKILYLAQLLRIEFPNIFKRIMNNPDLMDDLATGEIKSRIVQERSEREKEEPKWQQKLKDISKELELMPAKENRLIELYKAIRGFSGFLPTEQFKNHFLVIEGHELFTWKEYSKYTSKLLKQNNSVVIQQLKKLISKARESREIERIREFIKMLVRDRDSVLSKTADTDDVEEMRKLLDYVTKIMRLCFLLLKVKELFSGRNPIFNGEAFKEWYNYLQKWAHFIKPDIYLKIRDQEKALAKKLASRVSAQASSILKVLRASFHGVTSAEAAFNQTRKEVINILEKALAVQLVERFSRPGGIKELWGQYQYSAEKELLFTNSPIFHNKVIYKKLKTISKKAFDNPEIRENFLEYVRMLFYAITEVTGWVRKEEAIELITKKKAFIETIWKASISRPVNRRTVGSLEQDRKKIQQVLKTTSIFPVPQWWSDLISDVN